MMTVDGAGGAIMSSDLDNRSLALNDELNLVVYNREMVGHLELLTAPAQTWPVRERL
jgi:phosphatidylserine/phosphatidylglycerophosphate/cardiolipin synthase-like enzyme